MSGKSYLPVLGDRGCPARHRLILPLRCPRGGLPQPRRLGGRWRHPTGGLPSLPPAAHAFSFDSAPYPPNPLPQRGRGRFLVFLCKGLRPLHPRGWMGRGTGSTCVSATRRGLALFAACRPLPLALILPPIPPPPSPAGKGEIFSFLMQGASPLASPVLDRLRRLQNLPSRCPVQGEPEVRQKTDRIAFL